MTGCSLRIAQYPWLAPFDRVNVRGESQPDGQVTDLDVMRFMTDTQSDTLLRQLNAPASVRADLFRIHASIHESFMRLDLLVLTDGPGQPTQFEKKGKAIFDAYLERIRRVVVQYNEAGTSSEATAVRDTAKQVSGVLKNIRLLLPHTANMVQIAGYGIGAQLAEQGGRVLIGATFSNSPAQKAGLLQGDEILAIGGVIVLAQNGKEIRYPEPHDLHQKLMEVNSGVFKKLTNFFRKIPEFSLLDIASFSIRGPLNTDVVLKIRRSNGQDATLTTRRDWPMLPSQVIGGDPLFAERYKALYQDKGLDSPTASIWHRWKFGNTLCP